MDIFDEYYCFSDYCVKEPIDGQPPCCTCENCISHEDLYLNQLKFDL